MLEALFCLCRSDAIEPILSLSLFPADFSIRDKVKKWVRIFSGFDKIEVTALEKILEQKQRFVEILDSMSKVFVVVSISLLSCFELDDLLIAIYILFYFWFRLQQEMQKYLSLRQLSQVSSKDLCDSLLAKVYVYDLIKMLVPCAGR